MTKLVNGEYFEQVTGQVDSAPVMVTADVDITQKIVVTTAGTPVQGPDKTNAGGWWVKAGTINTGVMYFMFHGQTAANKGFPLSAGQVMFLPVANLSGLDFDATVNGEKVVCSKA